jgi:hypothetical protein
VSEESISSELTSTVVPPATTSSTSIVDEPIVVNKILLVNTENIKHDEYEKTPEMKVG